jgi:aspartate kinase
MIQNGAVQLMAVFDDHPEKIGQLAALAEEIFNVVVQKHLNMFTIRHYTEEALKLYAEGIEPILVQRTKETVQMVYSDE